MVDYQLIINFEYSDVAKFNSQGYRLCFAVGVEGSGNPFTVIALCDTLQSRTEISWSDQYSMAATRDRTFPGMKFMMAVQPSEIRSKQKYTLPEDWTRGRVEDDKNVGDGSFLFANDGGREATAILLQRIGRDVRPIYVSGGSVPPRSTQSFTPKNEIAVWVDNRAEAGTIISRSSGSQSTFSMSGRTNLEVKWTGSRFEAV